MDNNKQISTNFIMSAPKKSILIIGEFSVFHRGYTEFLHNTAGKGEDCIFFAGILGKSLIKKLTAMEEDIRNISFDDKKRIINSYLNIKKFLILEKGNFMDQIDGIDPEKIIILTGDKSEDFAKIYLSEPDLKKKIQYSDIRLRWQNSKVLEFKKEASKLSKDELESHKKFMTEAFKEAEQSKCWWRQVGAVTVKNNKIISRGFNQMLPNEDECYKIGCVRDSIAPGKSPEICSVTHAEATIVSLAAKKGLPLEGATLYVTHFPCPACAKLVALAGFKRIVYARGSSVFDGERVIASKGIDIIKI